MPNQLPVRLFRDGGFYRLPIEIWDIILRQIVEEWDGQYARPAYYTRLSCSRRRRPASPHPLFALASVCKYFYAVTAKHIDLWIKIDKLKTPIKSTFGDINDFKSNSGILLRRSVVSVANLEVGEKFFKTLKAMHHLHSLTMSKLYISSGALECLASMFSLTELHWLHTGVKEQHVDAAIPDLSRMGLKHYCHVGHKRQRILPKKILFSSSTITLQISFCISLRYLGLESEDAEALFKEHSRVFDKFQRPTLPSLVEFVLFGGFTGWAEPMEEALGRFLECTPALRALRFLEDQKKFFAATTSSITFSQILVPELDEIYGPTRLLRLFIPGRTIKSVTAHVQSQQADKDMIALWHLINSSPKIEHFAVVMWNWSKLLLTTLAPFLPELKTLKVTCGAAEVFALTNWAEDCANHELHEFPKLQKFSLFPDGYVVDQHRNSRTCLKCPGTEPTSGPVCLRYLEWIKRNEHWEPSLTHNQLASMLTT